MSNAVYPSLPGLTFDVTRTPIWSTDVKSTRSGREFRGAWMTSPLYQYTLVYEFLRDKPTAQELRTLLGFFNQAQGAFGTFLLPDPDDQSVTAQAFGSGDGASTAFQLVRTLGGAVEPVYDLNGAPQIYHAGLLMAAGTDYTINATGGVTFTNPPGAGEALTWTGSYYWRCRFLNDTLDFHKLMQAIWEAKRVELKTVKP
jgi:uncharacterized protein (TIGR02217 family)